MHKSLGPSSTARRRPLTVATGNKAVEPPIGKPPPPATPAASRVHTLPSPAMPKSLTARRVPLAVLPGNMARPAVESQIVKPTAPRTPAAEVDASLARTDYAGIVSQSLGANSTAQRRPLAVLSGNKARPALESLTAKPHPPPAPAAEVDAALDRLFLARTNLAGIVSQVDELISDALKCQTLSKRATQDLESFNGFLTDTEASFKQWSSRLKQALETDLVKNGAISKDRPETCLNTAAKGNGKLISGSSKLPDTDPVESPCSNFAEADMTISPSPLVLWHPGSCMVESGKQLFQLTPLPKTEACSSRCTTSKTQIKTASSIEQLNNVLRPVSKRTISEDNHPDLEQSVKVKESWTGTMTPRVAPANKVSLEDKLCSPCTSSIQKSRALPISCLKTTLSSKQQFSPIPEGSRKEDVDSSYGPSGDEKLSGSSDEISKDLATRYNIYGLDRSTFTRQAVEPLEWFLSPLKTMVLTEPSSDSDSLPTPAMSRALPRSCLKTALSSKQQFSPILEGSRKEDIDSSYGPSGDEKPSGSSDEISKDLATRYNIYGLNRSTFTRQAEEPLEWFLSPLKTIMLAEPSSSDNDSLPTPAMSNMEGKLNVPDDKPIQTPALHSKVLFGSPWKGMESTNLKGESTLKRELWIRFDAATPGELHFDKARFQKTDPRCLLDMLEEDS